MEYVTKEEFQKYSESVRDYFNELKRHVEHIAKGVNVLDERLKEIEKEDPETVSESNRIGLGQVHIRTNDEEPSVWEKSYVEDKDKTIDDDVKELLQKPDLIQRLMWDGNSTNFIVGAEVYKKGELTKVSIGLDQFLSMCRDLHCPLEDMISRERSGEK